jgi:TetR/AcrR family tetracycline transcriptional repressor
MSARPEIPAEPLSLETVVLAAAELIEADGVGALTMRRLAASVGCSPMALYRHVETKQDLIRAIGEHYLSDLELPDTAGMSWEDAIVAVASAAHRAFLAHSPLLEIVAVQHVDAIGVLQASEVILGALRSAGLGDREAVRGLSVITSYAVGATQRKAEQRTGVPAEIKRLQRVLQLPEEDFPALRALAGELVTVDLELSFEDGLRMLLRGIVS